MKKINLPHIQNISVLNEDGSIEVCHRLAKDVGNCNACTNRDIEHVYEITLRSLSFRLCYKCKTKLINKLRG